MPVNLERIILEQDSLLFEEAFNRCGTKVLDEIIADDFTFYHDQSGITESKIIFIDGIENGICQLSYKALRQLKRNSTYVYPLFRNDTLYGAIQEGEHSFYALEGNNHKYLTSEAKFTHVWILEGNVWKLKTALSFNHVPTEIKRKEGGLFLENQVTENWLKEKKVPLVGIGCIENGRIIQTSVFGQLENETPAPLNTIWNVASLTKPIIAVLTLKLVNDSLWDLDEALSHYYSDPDLKDSPYINLLTTRMVLSHQTGLPNWRGDKPLTFEFEPGTQYQYSGEGFEYLRKALEAKFKLPIEDLAEKYLFKPLKMNETQFVWDESMEHKPTASWYSETGMTYAMEHYYEANAADNLLTTIEDYSKFLTFVINGADLNPDLQKAMYSNQVKIGKYKHFGIGWWVDEKVNKNSDFAMVHGGDDMGVHCITFLLPNSKNGLVIFTNSDLGTNLYQEIIEFYLPEEAEGIFRAEMD